MNPHAWRLATRLESLEAISALAKPSPEWARFAALASLDDGDPDAVRLYWLTADERIATNSDGTHPFTRPWQSFSIARINRPPPPLPC